MGGPERTVTNLICVWLVIMPWLIGARFWWAQAMTAVVGVVALVVAVRSPEGRRALLAVSGVLDWRVVFGLRSLPGAQSLGRGRAAGGGHQRLGCDHR